MPKSKTRGLNDKNTVERQRDIKRKPSGAYRITFLTALIAAVLICACCVLFSSNVFAGKLSLNYTSVTLQKGSKLHLRTVPAKNSTGRKTVWKSSRKKTVSVSRNGVITARKKGKAVITARKKGSLKTAKCTVTVTAKKNKNSGILVAYFSATGTTKAVAKKIASATGGDLYRITPAKKYSAKDLNYVNDKCRANTEQSDRNARPALKGDVPDISSYDVIFLGYPVWYGKAPKVLSTFVESLDFSGKTVIPFCTSGSSPFGASDSALKSSVKNVSWRAGKRFAAGASLNTVRTWTDGLGLKSADDAAAGEGADMKLTIGTADVSVRWENNDSVDALKELCKAHPLVINLRKNGDFEQFGPVGVKLPSNDVKIRAESGDIVLYNSNQIVLLYGTNTWAYTRLGKITDPDAAGLKRLLGGDDVTITIKYG